MSFFDRTKKEDLFLIAFPLFWGYMILKDSKGKGIKDRFLTPSDSNQLEEENKFLHEEIKEIIDDKDKEGWLSLAVLVITFIIFIINRYLRSIGKSTVKFKWIFGIVASICLFILDKNKIQNNWIYKGLTDPENKWYQYTWKYMALSLPVIFLIVYIYQCNKRKGEWSEIFLCWPIKEGPLYLFFVSLITYQFYNAIIEPVTKTKLVTEYPLIKKYPWILNNKDPLDQNHSTYTWGYLSLIVLFLLYGLFGESGTKIFSEIDMLESKSFDTWGPFYKLHYYPIVWFCFGFLINLWVAGKSYSWSQVTFNDKSVELLGAWVGGILVSILLFLPKLSPIIRMILIIIGWTAFTVLYNKLNIKSKKEIEEDKDTNTEKLIKLPLTENNSIIKSIIKSNYGKNAKSDLYVDSVTIFRVIYALTILFILIKSKNRITDIIALIIILFTFQLSLSGILYAFNSSRNIIPSVFMYLNELIYSGKRDSKYRDYFMGAGYSKLALIFGISVALAFKVSDKNILKRISWATGIFGIFIISWILFIGDKSILKRTFDKYKDKEYERDQDIVLEFSKTTIQNQGGLFLNGTVLIIAIYLTLADKSSVINTGQ